MMNVSATNDYFIKDGKYFFYLADTVWTVFSNATLEEWEEYLDYRKTQGFNAFQVNVLTQWDGGKPDIGIYPFAVDSEGKFDFANINDAYFERAQSMLEMAAQKGFTPALVVLWGNYVPDTWMSCSNPTNVMPLEHVAKYTEYVVEKFSKFEPIYIVSGDTDFSEKAIIHYVTALKKIRELDEKAITTLHITSGRTDIPEEFFKEQLIDFYLYQSGHVLEEQRFTYEQAQKFYEKPVKLPIINGEPCYEASYFGGKYGRYSAFDIRKAIWQSLLSGAKAGITYGAQGLWGWFKEGKEFANEGFGGKPLPWKKALHLKGAWGAGFARWAFETYQLWDIEPVDKVLNPTSEIRMSISKNMDKIAVYVPYNTDVTIDMDLTSFEFTLFDLEDRHIAKPEVMTCDGKTVIKMHSFSSDVLILGLKNER